jgi:hypothetical protein
MRRDELIAAVKVQANLRGVNLAGLDLSNAPLRGARLPEANLRGTNFTGADLRGADLRGAKVEGATFEGAILDGVRRGELESSSSPSAHAAASGTDRAAPTTPTRATIFGFSGKGVTWAAAGFLGIFGAFVLYACIYMALNWSGGGPPTPASTKKSSVGDTVYTAASCEKAWSRLSASAQQGFGGPNGWVKTCTSPEYHASMCKISDPPGGPAVCSPEP